MDIKELAVKFSEAQAEVMKLSERQSEEIKKLGDASADTMQKIENAGKAMEAAQTEIKAFQARMDEMDKKMQTPSGGAEQHKGYAQRLVESDEYKNNDGKSMRPFSFKSFFEKKDISTIVANAGYDVHPMRIPELVYDPGQRPLHVREVMNIGQTTSNSVEFVRETAFINNAAAVEEDPEYGKPISNFDFALINSPVSTIAHWVRATRQVLSDVPMMLSYVSGRLVYGLKVAEDNDILFGNGLNGAMTGIMVTPGVPPIGPGPIVPGDTNIDTIRRAIALARLSEYPCDAVIMNPADWAVIELTKEVVNLGYIWANVAAGNAPRIWGLPVIETTAMPAGQFLVGSFRLGAQLWDREQASIRISEHHEDYFTNNLIVILAEERLALTVYRPNAFVNGTF